LFSLALGGDLQRLHEGQQLPGTGNDLVLVAGQAAAILLPALQALTNGGQRRLVQSIDPAVHPLKSHVTVALARGTLPTNTGTEINL